jgi:hypothetical protein
MTNLLKFSVLIIVVFLLSGNKNDLPNTDLPNIDLHVHLNYAAQSLNNNAAIAYQKASALSKEMGVTFGIAEEFGTNNVRTNDSLALDRIALAKKNSLYLDYRLAGAIGPKYFPKRF